MQKEELYFYNDQHELNFAAVLERYPDAKVSKEYRAAAYIVAHPEIYPEATRPGEEWEYIFDDWAEREVFSRGIRVLLEAGFHLYNGGHSAFNLADGINIWDTGNYLVFRQACDIRKSWA